MSTYKDDTILKKEVSGTLKNVSVNFKFFEFKTYSAEEKSHVIKVPFPKYRSFETNSVVLFYKHVSRVVNF